MGLEPTMSSAPPVAAWPLDYGNEALDPFLAVIRTIGKFLIVVGSLQLVYRIVQIAVAGTYNSYGGPSRLYGWETTILIDVQALIQIFAGVVNARPMPDMKWLWVWIWSSVFIQLANAAMWIWTCSTMAGGLRATSMAEITFERFVHLPSACAFPICVAIILIVRRRVMAAQPAR